jgi:hypothetical protein
MRVAPQAPLRDCVGRLRRPIRDFSRTGGGLRPEGVALTPFFARGGVPAGLGG